MSPRILRRGRMGYPPTIAAQTQLKKTTDVVLLPERMEKKSDGEGWDVCRWFPLGG